MTRGKVIWYRALSTETKESCSKQWWKQVIHSMAEPGLKWCKIYPLAIKGGRSGLLFAFLGATGLGEGDVENDRDLQIKSKDVLKVLSSLIAIDLFPKNKCFIMLYSVILKKIKYWPESTCTQHELSNFTIINYHLFGVRIKTTLIIESPMLLIFSSDICPYKVLFSKSH